VTTRIAPAPPATRFDVTRIRREFPILGTTVRGRSLVYLDNAATSQKPLAVIEATDRYYREQNANIHRAVHYLSETASRLYEETRAKVAEYLGVDDPRRVVFVRGATEAINLVASSWGRTHVGPGDEVLVTAMEHHANIVPWQLLCEEKGAHLRVIPMDRTGTLLLDEAERLFSPRTRILAFPHISNSLGTINPAGELIAMAHARGVPVLVDGAQAVPHGPVNVDALGADFYAISGHKMFGPTGIGVLVGRADLLETMPPYQGGGDMIRSVTFAKTTYAPIPGKFEAGTPDIAGVIGLGAAVDWLAALDWDSVAAHEASLLADAVEQICDVPGVTLVGTAAHKAAVVSFVMDGIHAHDIGTIVDQDGVAVRTGHHCTQPVMDFFGVAATTRASFALYNTHEEVAVLAASLRRVRAMFG
jgi:cysteine desulfurase/selenocysteine lyase